MERADSTWETSAASTRRQLNTSVTAAFGNHRSVVKASPICMNPRVGFIVLLNVRHLVFIIPNAERSQCACANDVLAQVLSAGDLPSLTWSLTKRGQSRGASRSLGRLSVPVTQRAVLFGTLKTESAP